jgi:uncharacterized protein (TIGR02266 family)
VTAPGVAAAAARQGREALAAALLKLQTIPVDDPSLDQAVEATAAASSALYDAEAPSTTEEGASRWIHEAADALQRALQRLEELRGRHADLPIATAGIARTLALLYPVLQLSLRQRRARMQSGALSDSDAEELRALAGFPRAPVPTGQSRRPSMAPVGERRTRGDTRVFLEVEIGLTSESHFYTGLSLDLSTGGVFVATYEPARIGTVVQVYFVLPDGHVVNAEGVVRWSRDATADAPPGMGVAFVGISAASLAHIAQFCASRPPLYFDV